MAKDLNGKGLPKSECRQAIFTNVSRIKDVIALQDLMKISGILRRHHGNAGDKNIGIDEYKILSIFHGSMKLNSDALENIEFFVSALIQEDSTESNKPQRSGNS